MMKEIQESRDISEENRRTLRGHNGDVGLVGRVENVEQKVDTITKGIVAILIFVITTGVGLFIQHILAN